MKTMLKTLFFCAVAFIFVAKFAPQSHVNAMTPVEIADSPVSAALPDDALPPCVKMYYAIEKFAPANGIPLNYAYGIAYAETHYRGPFHWEYRHDLTSPGGALGPMQIMPQYAGAYIDGDWDKFELRTNIDMNVQVSMRLLRRLKDRNYSWPQVFGAYNTGQPVINDYARRVYAFDAANFFLPQ